MSTAMHVESFDPPTLPHILSTDDPLYATQQVVIEMSDRSGEQDPWRLFDLANNHYADTFGINIPTRKLASLVYHWCYIHARLNAEASLKQEIVP